MNGGACSYLCTKVEETSKIVEITGDQVDEPLYETVESVIKARIRKEVTIAEQQFGYMPGRSTIDAIFCLRTLLEKWTKGQKAVHCTFIDLEKAYDRVLREELRECLRLAETSKCYIRIIKDMYDGATTTVRSVAGLTKKFKIGVGLHQGSALSPFLFAIIIDKQTEGHQEGCTIGICCLQMT